MAETAEGTEPENEVIETPEVEAPADKTFTQADLDRVVEQRLVRERKKFADYDDLKTKAEQFDASEAEKLSAVERATQERDAALARQAELETDMWSARLHSGLLAEATKSERSIVDPEAAIEFLTGADSDLVDTDENGNPTNVADAMDKLLAKRTYLVGRKQTPSADQGARGGGATGQVTEAELQQMTPHEIVQARKDGRLDKLMGVSS